MSNQTIDSIMKMIKKLLTQEQVNVIADIIKENNDLKTENEKIKLQLKDRDATIKILTSNIDNTQGNSGVIAWY